MGGPAGRNRSGGPLEQPDGAETERRAGPDRVAPSSPESWARRSGPARDVRPPPAPLSGRAARGGVASRGPVRENA
ncbi:hypothetical protein JCM4814A_06060 [Streptomyces phaeofaciens JCM 4814]|uniref:Uncharacterized protein n=1 Tax=Streptomyces phaeofaciens TaxID=68254 RepID=A0A918LV82_9ACTN|nr:hypothetical protein GCM10010226_34450 [Streptomyces phaeofaciens]